MVGILQSMRMNVYLLLAWLLLSLDQGALRDLKRRDHARAPTLFQVPAEPHTILGTNSGGAYEMLRRKSLV